MTQMNGFAAKISVTPEGRDDIWIADRESLKAWIVAQEFESIHNMATSVPGMMLGADHDVEGVLADIDSAEQVAIMTGPMRSHNMGHALAIIAPPERGLPQRLEMYDIGEVTTDDLAVSK
jgi:hypothetical protein